MHIALGWSSESEVPGSLAVWSSMPSTTGCHRPKGTWRGGYSVRAAACDVVGASGIAAPSFRSTVRPVREEKGCPRNRPPAQPRRIL